MTFKQDCSKKLTIASAQIVIGLILRILLPCFCMPSQLLPIINDRNLQIEEASVSAAIAQNRPIVRCAGVSRQRKRRHDWLLLLLRHVMRRIQAVQRVREIVASAVQRTRSADARFARHGSALAI